jgi:hypothetical protein
MLSNLDTRDAIPDSMPSNFYTGDRNLDSMFSNFDTKYSIFATKI